MKVGCPQLSSPLRSQRQFVATERLLSLAYDGSVCTFSGGANMAAGADHHRDVAAQFRSLAAIEPSDSLREHLQRITQRHDELAADFERRDSEIPRIHPDRG